MKHGYVKAAALTPGIRVADTVYNTEQIKKGLDEAFAEAAKIIVFPELCITGYTCQDLVFQETLLKGATEGLRKSGNIPEGGTRLFRRASFGKKREAVQCGGGSPERENPGIYPEGNHTQLW